LVIFLSRENRGLSLPIDRKANCTVVVRDPGKFFHARGVTPVEVTFI
jgi:hypothetical protein